jgi:hypothetical protein
MPGDQPGRLIMQRAHRRRTQLIQSLAECFFRRKLPQSQRSAKELFLSKGSMSA